MLDQLAGIASVEPAIETLAPPETERPLEILVEGHVVRNRLVLSSTPTNHGGRRSLLGVASP